MPVNLPRSQAVVVNSTPFLSVTSDIIMTFYLRLPMTYTHHAYPIGDNRLIDTSLGNDMESRRRRRMRQDGFNSVLFHQRSDAASLFEHRRILKLLAASNTVLASRPLPQAWHRLTRPQLATLLPLSFR